jgi:hypothetical protein
MIAKVNALLARAAHPTTPEEEARTSAFQAIRLATKHGVKLTVGGAGDVRTVAEAMAKVRVAEARADAADRARRDAEARALAAELLADAADGARRAAEARASAAETRASAAGETAAPPSEKRARHARASAPDESEIPNNRRGEPPQSGPQCQGATGWASCGGAAAPPPPPSGGAAKQSGRKVMESRFRGVCDHCDRGYKRGDRISWERGGPVYHEACATAAGVAA